MIEFLVSQGHREAELLDHSIDRLRDLFEDAQVRIQREAAAFELSMMNAVANGAGALISKQGVRDFNQAQRALVQKANGTEAPQDIKGNLERLTQNLLSIGARRSYSPPKTGSGNG